MSAVSPKTSQTSSGVLPLDLKEMRQIVMSMDKVPQVNSRGLPLGPGASASPVKAGSSTFGAAKRFSKPLYMGSEVSKEQAMSNAGTLGQGMYIVNNTRDGKPLNLGKAVKHPTTTGFGMEKRFKEPSARDAKAPPFYDARCDRNGMPMKLRPDSTPKFAKSTRGVNLYEGKEDNSLRGARGTYGPGGYDVKVSRTGYPLMRSPQSTTSFGKGERFPKKKDYLVDHPRVLDPSKARAFGTQASSLKRTGSTPTFGNSTRAQVDKLHISKAFFSTQPRAMTWVDPRP